MRKLLHEGEVSTAVLTTLTNTDQEKQVLKNLAVCQFIIPSSTRSGTKSPAPQQQEPVDVHLSQDSTIWTVNAHRWEWELIRRVLLIFHCCNCISRM